MELSRLTWIAKNIGDGSSVIDSCHRKGFVMAGFPDADFCLYLDFERGTEQPTRVFQAMINLINTLQGIESGLLHSIQPELNPVFILEDLETSSLKTWIRRKINGTLKTIDSEALKSGDWKKVLGSYLSKGVNRLIAATGEPEVTRDSLRSISCDIATLAEETGLSALTLYEPMGISEVATHLQSISSATVPLLSGDRISLLTEFGETPVHIGFNLTPDRLDEILTAEIITNESIEILKIRKPDLLGDAQWEFRLGKDPFTAKLCDVEWLHRFRARHIVLQSGDAQRVKVRTTTKFGHDREIVSLHREILNVLEEQHLPSEPILEPLLPTSDPIVQT